MFCSECGKPVQGKFCCHCGARLVVPGAAAEVIPRVLPEVQSIAEPVGPVDWEREVNYESILQFPGVRDQIERHARMATKKLTGEQFMKMADKVMPMAVPLEGLSAVVQPLFSRMGLNTGKQQLRQIPAPVGRVIVRALCSLARHGQSLRGVSQGTDGCLLEAALPSDVLSLEGDLLVGLQRSGPLTVVSGATRIQGQLFDWGKSNRCLEQLFTDLAREAA